MAHPLEHPDGPISTEATSRRERDPQTKADCKLKPQSADTNMAMVGEHNEL
jgi:hypothetical protein